MSLAGKVVLITGSSNGIGKACAQRVASEGASVAINYSRDAASANALVESIGVDRAVAIQADASTIAGVEKLVNETVAKFGKIDVLMPNAGSMPMRTLEKTTEADFDFTYNINVKGPYFLCQKALPHIPSGGRIVLVSTGITKNSFVPAPYLLYASTKGAIDQMTRAMSKDLATKGINVNAIAPGPTGTDLFYEGKPEAMVKMIENQSPYGRVGEVDEIANVFQFLCSKDSSWVTGQILHVNGGAFV